MLPFEHVRKAANPVQQNTQSPNAAKRTSSPQATANVIAAAAPAGTRSGALRPHSRAAATNNQNNNNKQSPIPFTSPNHNIGTRAATAKTTTTLTSASSSIFNTTINTSSSAITSPLKPSSARRRLMMNTTNISHGSANSRTSPARSGGIVTTTTMNRQSGATTTFRDTTTGVSPIDVTPDFQLCVNYKKVDITVNDAKHHLRVRPPKIRAAVTAVECDLDPFEFPHLFSVACGLDDVGVDHSVLFFVVAANPECFSAAPTVDCEGTLRFQVKPPAPGSVHMEKTSLHITAWDALSLTGSAIGDHADEVHELEEGVPFCDPIKLEVTFTYNTAINHNSQNRRSPSPSSSSSASPNNNNNNQNVSRQLHTCHTPWNDLCAQSVILIDDRCDE